MAQRRKDPPETRPSYPAPVIDLPGPVRYQAIVPPSESWWCCESSDFYQQARRQQNRLNGTHLVYARRDVVDA